MGLDITAYRRLKPEPEAVVDADGEPVDWQRHWRPGKSAEWSREKFPGRADDVDPDTIYSYEDAFQFRAGSYGGYGEFRTWLAKLVGIPTVVKDGHERPDFDTLHAEAEGILPMNHLAKPLAKLINFADNEGVIGATVAAELLDQFRALESRVGNGGYNGEKFREWIKACEFAADNGAISFH